MLVIGNTNTCINNEAVKEVPWSELKKVTMPLKKVSH